MYRKVCFFLSANSILQGILQKRSKSDEDQLPIYIWKSELPETFTDCEPYAEQVRFYLLVCL